LSNVVYVDSFGVSALIAIARSRPRGTRIVVSSLCEYVRDVFEVTGVFKMFDVFANATTAMKAIENVRR
jgi:anti-anti-sigma factor